MVTATIDRNGTTVTFDLIETGGNLLIARDVGKPNLSINETGDEDPRSQDYWSALVVWTVIGRFTGNSAYGDAQTLAESIVKPRLDTDETLDLDLSNITDLSTYTTVPNGGSALTLTYDPGMRNNVIVQLQLVEIDSVDGGTQDSTATISPDSGSGIKLERPGGASVTFGTDQQVTRTIGREGASIDRQPSDLPRYVDKQDPATDVFELSVELTDGISQANRLIEDVLKPQLAGGALRLHFLSNLFSLDAYDVVPTGSQAGRAQLGEAGRKGTIRQPKIALRVVNNT